MFNLSDCTFNNIKYINIMLHSNINYLWMGKKKKSVCLYRTDIWRIIVFEFFFLETDQVGWTQEPHRLGWQKQYEHINELKALTRQKKAIYFFFSSSIKCTHAFTCVIPSWKCIFLFCNRKETEDRVCNNKKFYSIVADELFYHT